MTATPVRSRHPGSLPAAPDLGGDRFPGLVARAAALTRAKAGVTDEVPTSARSVVFDRAENRRRTTGAVLVDPLGR